MTKQKKILLSIIGAVAVIALVIAGFFVFNNNNEEPNPAGPSNSSAPTAGPSAPSTPSAEPTPGETITVAPQAPAEDSADQLVEANELFPEAGGTTTHSKEEVQLALFTAYNYANQTTSDAYFFGGKFMEEGMNVTNFDERFGAFYTVDGFSNINNAFANLNSANETDKTDAQETILSNVLYSYAGADSGYTVPESCTNGGEGCLKSTTPVFGELSYTDDPNNAERILVQFSLTSDPNYIYNGEQGHIDFKYTYNLYMIAATDENKRTEGFNYSYLIDGFQNNVDRSAWKKG